MENKALPGRSEFWISLGQIGIPFCWLGMVVAISFIEAPLKFRAPGITLPLGLGIGSLIFSVLNKIELVFAVTLLLLHSRRNAGRFSRVILMTICIGLSLQTLWLLPALTERAALIVSGSTPAASYHHLAFGVLEVLKAVLLLMLGSLTLRRYLLSPSSHETEYLKASKSTSL